MAHSAVKSGSLRDEHYCQARMLKANQIAPVKDTKTKSPTFFSALLLYFSLAEGQRTAQQALQQPLNLSERKKHFIG